MDIQMNVREEKYDQERSYMRQSKSDPHGGKNEKNKTEMNQVYKD